MGWRGRGRRTKARLSPRSTTSPRSERNYKDVPPMNAGARSEKPNVEVGMPWDESSNCLGILVEGIGVGPFLIGTDPGAYLLVLTPSLSLSAAFLRNPGSSRERTGLNFVAPTAVCAWAGRKRIGDRRNGFHRPWREHRRCGGREQLWCQCCVFGALCMGSTESVESRDPTKFSQRIR